ncbi:MAG: short chain dehydrogenase [Zetaproteobacteria bacterium CG12_big_fil_rev_8_21_14_0_65_55_1124]|nr:MAG: short chain dehydrogenase [Zetaproteobacteria bacterium CG1_02_55_237]PIS19979.1 MAG: short chain dehydrogenase [Zetaproteobacteria bacterium CG08_land_8_20_14_0_20_55_17]PIW43599.1 MAG: short chain dehydrogenase [Zetaproteobacteria bacterium CG12_big_fil_rev_8_21_14_0_65_55_1124]PIY52733.1 MAG: short chain dehydrogenase [Zetaproteobacteria bacterium CG_4_10_14_0_8_um_filter_55_43]PIZ37917.1 MAG: short chain dehydrogenase [Zetaproteobacteria bacterium CG_4_10_14_0_2_um_filter_55_20]PJB
MDLRDKNVVLTGAAGGIGRLLAASLAGQGANMALVDANEDALKEVAAGIKHSKVIAGDLSSAEGCLAVADAAKKALGKVDVLINLAGLMSFRCFEEEDLEVMERIIGVNLLGAMRLTRHLLPGMLERNQGRIINVGSVFGSIGFAYFTAYSASKFGLRGFSEALRRELHDTPIKVMYLAPRAVKTPLNTGRIMRMGAATKMNMDTPELVVEKILQAINNDRKEVYIGFPESLFVQINQRFPRLVDKALAAQNRIARAFAKEKGN